MRKRIMVAIGLSMLLIAVWAYATPEMVLVKAGAFEMGNTRNDEEGEGLELPVHLVKFTYDYYIGKYEVTFDKYDLFCNETEKLKPSDKTILNLSMGRGQNPVINVTWFDAIEYCNWLSKKEGLAKAYDNKGKLLDKNSRQTTDISQVEGYRLPTEAEWEYAARGGHKSKGDYKYAGSNNIDKIAWTWCDSIQNVGQKPANELGIFDMTGNVSEWCYDWLEYSTFETKKSGFYANSPLENPINFNKASFRVTRGGNWNFPPSYCRVSYRSGNHPKMEFEGVGFRVARTK